MDQRDSKSTEFKLGVTWVWVVNAMPRPLYIQENPSTHRIEAGEGHSGWIHKILPPVGFDAQNIQPVVIRYTTC